jgi:hypothetical protein
VTDLNLSVAQRVAIEIRYNFNCTSLPWDDCVFEVIDRWRFSADECAGMNDDLRQELVDTLAYAGPTTSEAMAPIIQEFIDGV